WKIGRVIPAALCYVSQSLEGPSNIAHSTPWLWLVLAHAFRDKPYRISTITWLHYRPQRLLRPGECSRIQWPRLDLTRLRRLPWNRSPRQALLNTRNSTLSLCLASAHTSPSSLDR